MIEEKIKIKENYLGDEIYNILNWSNSKTIFFFASVAFIFFFFNFPITDSLKTVVENQIYAIPGRPISFAKMDIDYLLFPGLDFELFKYHSEDQEIKFKTLVLDIVRPSVFPPGVRIEIEAETDRSHLEVKTSLSFLSHRLIIDNTKLSDDLLGQIFAHKLKIHGNIDVDLQTSLYKEGLNYAPIDGKILLKSKNLELPPQLISGLEIPSLPLKNFVFEAEIDDHSKINISKIELGTPLSPFFLKGSGTIHFNAKSIMMSKLALNTEISFSKQFFENFALLKMLLENKKKVNDMYQVKIQGTLASPIPLIQD